MRDENLHARPKLTASDTYCNMCTSAHNVFRFTQRRANGDAVERRSAYAKASVFAEASAYALCARTVKTADKSADKYDPPSRLRASAFAEPTAATSSCPTLVHILQYVYERVQSVLPRMERLPAHPLKSHPPTHIAICVRGCTVGD